jgi:hypothetical protein
MQSGTAAVRYPRGYEIVSSKIASLQAVKIKMKLSEGPFGCAIPNISNADYNELFFITCL